MKNIGQLENRKSLSQASVNTINRHIDLQQVQLKDDCEVAELCMKENIMRLKEHAETIKLQNQSLSAEMEELLKLGDFARE